MPGTLRARARRSYALNPAAARRAASARAPRPGLARTPHSCRGVEFADEELLLTAEEAAARDVTSFVEKELIDDALADEEPA